VTRSSISELVAATVSEEEVVGMKANAAIALDRSVAIAPATNDPLYTVDATAKRLGMKPETIRAWIATRRIGFHRINGRAIRIPESEIQRLLEAGFTPARGIQK
jgi:excisionase family DNA binding protein